MGAMSDIPALDEAAVRWSGSVQDRPTIVLLHGYGSNEDDLFGLVPLLPTDFAYVSVRAPLALGWPMGGHAWYPIEDLSGRDSGAITAAARRLLEWIGQALSGASSVGLMGFSQGGAVSVQALRLAPEVSFAVNLSGYAAPGELPGDDDLAARPRPVFWGRGDRDEVIPRPLVEHTSQWLPAHARLDAHLYPGMGHAICDAELAHLRAFLTARL
jgi:phospholipase/carboxylesterase